MYDLLDFDLLYNFTFKSYKKCLFERNKKQYEKKTELVYKVKKCLSWINFFLFNINNQKTDRKFNELNKAQN